MSKHDAALGLTVEQEERARTLKAFLYAFHKTMAGSQTC